LRLSWPKIPKTIFSNAVCRFQSLFGDGNLIEERLSSDEILKHGFHQGNGINGVTGQRRLNTEQEFANFMAAKDIYVFGSYPHQFCMDIHQLLQYIFNSTPI